MVRDGRQEGGRKGGREMGGMATWRVCMLEESFYFINKYQLRF